MGALVHGFRQCGCAVGLSGCLDFSAFMGLNLSDED